VGGTRQFPLERVDGFRWRIPRESRPGMRVDGLVYADDLLIRDIQADQALEQAQAEDALKEFERQMGLVSPETTRVSDDQKEVGPARKQKGLAK